MTLRAEAGEHTGWRLPGQMMATAAGGMPKVSAECVLSPLMKRRRKALRCCGGLAASTRLCLAVQSQRDWIRLFIPSISQIKLSGRAHSIVHNHEKRCTLGGGAPTPERGWCTGLPGFRFTHHSKETGVRQETLSRAGACSFAERRLSGANQPGTWFPIRVCAWGRSGCTPKRSPSPKNGFAA